MQDDPTSGHLKLEKMLGKLRNSYYWYGMQSEADNYCKSCALCASRKPAVPSPVAPMQPIVVNNTMEMIAMDICGPYSTSEAANK